MLNNLKRSAALALSAAALTVSMGAIGTSVATSAVASDMNLNATGGEGTLVDKDGTQGDIKAAVQGSQRTGAQEAFDTASFEAVPQLKASAK